MRFAVWNYNHIYNLMIDYYIEYLRIINSKSPIAPSKCYLEAMNKSLGIWAKFYRSEYDSANRKFMQRNSTKEDFFYNKDDR